MEVFDPTDFLDLSNYRMGPNIPNLLKTLRTCSKLTKLDLSGINLDTEGSYKLAHLFRVP